VTRRPDDGPRHVREGLDVVADRFGHTDATALATVFTRWNEVAGPALAEHVRPLRLQDGVLVLAADHPAWATEARSLTGVLTAKVRAATGRAPVRVDVVVRSAPDVRSRGPDRVD
jgi:predicted nucleic acid-binding Zn ribbon protein